MGNLKDLSTKELQQTRSLLQKRLDEIGMSEDMHSVAVDNQYREIKKVQDEIDSRK